MNNIHEILEYGPIVATNEELDILITVNGAYYNVWCGDFSGKYECKDCYATSFENGLHGADMAKVMDRAEALLDEITNTNKEGDE